MSCLNGVTLEVGYDPWGRGRPRFFRTVGVANGRNWVSGEYHFDGSGNVVQIGSSRYLYDRVSRLRQAEMKLWLNPGVIFLDGFESGTVDGWG